MITPFDAHIAHYRFEIENFARRVRREAEAIRREAENYFGALEMTEPTDNAPLPPTRPDDGYDGSWYDLPKGATQLKHLIWAANMNGQVAEAFRSLYRLGRCPHSDPRRDLLKARAYIDQELERMDLYEPEPPRPQMLEIQDSIPHTYPSAEERKQKLKDSILEAAMPQKPFYPGELKK